MSAVRAIILGCGPNLIKDLIPRDGDFYIGVNRSLQVMSTPVVCTADLRFYAKRQQWAAVARSPEPKWVFSHNMKGCTPHWANTSGPFAMWYARVLGATEMILVGFGGLGHFYRDELEDFQEGDERWAPNLPAFANGNNNLTVGAMQAMSDVRFCIIMPHCVCDEPHPDDLEKNDCLNYRYPTYARAKKDPST